MTKQNIWKPKTEEDLVRARERALIELKRAIADAGDRLAADERARLELAVKLREAEQAILEGFDAVLKPWQVRLARIEEPEIYDAWVQLNDFEVAGRLELAVSKLNEAQTALQSGDVRASGEVLEAG